MYPIKRMGLRLVLVAASASGIFATLPANTHPEEHFDFTGDADPTDLTCAEKAAASAGLLSLFPFTGATAGTEISDGGSDMYDGGNQIRLQVKCVHGIPTRAPYLSPPH